MSEEDVTFFSILQSQNKCSLYAILCHDIIGEKRQQEMRQEYQAQETKENRGRNTDTYFNTIFAWWECNTRGLHVLPDNKN